jgi:hypothetical protein
VSAKNLADDRLFDDVVAALATHHVPATMLTVEITASCLVVSCLRRPSTPGCRASWWGRIIEPRSERTSFRGPRLDPTREPGYGPLSASEVVGMASDDERKDDERLLARAEEVLTELKVSPGLSEPHAAVLAALRIRLKGDPGSNLDELLAAAGDLEGPTLDDAMQASKAEPPRSIDDLLSKPERPKRSLDDLLG